MLADIGTGLLNTAITIIAGGFVCTCAAIAIYFMLYLKKYRQYQCVIWERDGFGQLKESFDDAGIFIDKKTNNKRFFLRKNKIGLTPDKIKSIQSAKRKTVYLLKTGLKNFSFIDINISNPSISLSVGEEDVNWSINAYERQKKLFQNSLLLQMMPFIALSFVSIIILVMFIYFFRQFPILKEVAQSLKEAAQATAQARAGTVVLPS